MNNKEEKTEYEHLQRICDIVCEELKLIEEILYLPYPYGGYKHGRQIGVKIALDQSISSKIIAEKFNLKRKNSVHDILHSYRMKIHEYPEALVKDRYERCLNAYHRLYL